ncbi:MAG: YHS domain-containing (seleno)protein [Xanthobacteraceae bacterium]
MAFPGQPWKFRRGTCRKYLALAVLVAAAPTGPSNAGTSEQIVADRLTGVAIAGYDPVAYFVDAEPTKGNRDFELRFERGIFQFRNEGNRAAFAAHPEIYMPQFGGYDPVALARGVALAGNPLEWQIIGERLYLFYSAQSHAAFAANPKEAISVAVERWPEVRSGLLP